MNSEIQLDFNDVLIQPGFSDLESRSAVDMVSKRLKRIMNIDTNGIIAANMDGVGTMEVAKVLREYGCLTALHKHYTAAELIEHFQDESVSSHSFYSMGMSDGEVPKLLNVMRNVKKPFNVCIDVANGYMRAFHEHIRYIRAILPPESVILAGNVVDAAGAAKLRDLGVKFPKIGIGSGGVCLTRTQTGVGRPQFSAVLDSTIFKTLNTNAALRGYYEGCSDGGCVNPGDVAKAFVAGASMVMLGTMLSGTDEGGGEIVEIDGKQFVQFYGMSSKTAQNRHNGGLKNYRSSEGRTILTPYKGPMKNVIENILGGVRSACTYTGARDIDSLLKAGFVRVNNVINRSMEQYTVGM